MAQRVHEALGYAGIPSHFADDVPRLPGAEIEIDHGNDEMGGVFIDWRPSPSLDEAVMEATMEGRTDDPALQLFMTIAASARDAIIVILHASGIRAVPIDDYDIRPPAIHVLGSYVS